MLTTRVLEVENSNSRTQLSRRGTQTSDNFWSDIRKLQLTESREGEPLGQQERIRFNVSGTIFETFSKTLLRFPDTLLGSSEQLTLYYDEENDFYFFDRNRDAFESILFFYQSYGKLIKPANLGLKLFIEELKFFRMGEDIINRFMVKFRYPEEKNMEVPEDKTFCQRLWNFFEYPKSKFATAVAFFSVAVICISVIQFCIETMPVFKKKYSKALYQIEMICVAWFSLELLLRFISAPNKWKFIKSIMNLIDLVSILPFYMTLFSQLVPKRKEAPPFEFLRVVRLVRVLRVFKLSRHLRIFKILGLTIKSSFRELLLLLFFVLIAVVLSSSAVYFADTSFQSIPDAFWFSIITLTNVGYGDSVPVTSLGKIIGGFCAACGIIVLALPIPIVVSSFMYFYNLEKENQKLEKQERENRKRLSMNPIAEETKAARLMQRLSVSSKISPDQSQVGEDVDNMSEISQNSNAPNPNIS